MSIGGVIVSEGGFARTPSSSSSFGGNVGANIMEYNGPLITGLGSKNGCHSMWALVVMMALVLLLS